MALRIRTIGAGELAMVLDWARSEGWNPGLDDAEPFFAADREGFFIAEADGQAAAAISVVNHDERFAFLGLYICRPRFRGQGIAHRLWQEALGHAGQRTIGLDGVPDQQQNYMKSGFEPEGSTLRLRGKVPAAADAQVRSARDGDLAGICEMDRRAVGHDRHRFLVSWLAPTARRMSLVLEQDEAMTGFATIRACHEGAKIGPVIAADADGALRLIKASAAAFPSADVTIDVPARNGRLLGRLEGLGLKRSFPTARMYRGKPPRQDGHLQAVATLELG